MDNRKQRNNEFIGSGQIGELQVTKKSGGDKNISRRTGREEGFDARDRKASGHSNEAFQNSAQDGELTRLIEKAETRGDDHSLRTSGGEEERSDLQTNGNLPGSPFPKEGKFRKGLSKRNASPLRQAPKIPGMREPEDKSEPMSTELKENIRKYVDEPAES